jgi:hypothetical protein
LRPTLTETEQLTALHVLVLEETGRLLHDEEAKGETEAPTDGGRPIESAARTLDIRRLGPGVRDGDVLEQLLGDKRRERRK